MTTKSVLQNILTDILERCNEHNNAKKSSYVNTLGRVRSEIEGGKGNKQQENNANNAEERGK